MGVVYAEGSLGCGRTVWRSRGAVSAVIPADGCIDVILRGDDVHLAGPSTACIPTSPDVGETVGIRFDPGLAAGVLRFNPAEVRDLAAPLRDVVGTGRDGDAQSAVEGQRRSHVGGDDPDETKCENHATTLLVARSHRLERNGHETSPPLDRHTAPHHPVPSHWFAGLTTHLLALIRFCWACSRLPAL